MMFSEAGVGPGSWPRIPATVRQTWRDNAYTLLGQVNEQRPPFTRMDAESVRVPTLLVSGTETPDNTARVRRQLAAHIPEARVAMMSGAGHFMFEDDPVSFCAAVLKFLES
jgi:pimeloyl-ACP methyl ester carboxylesterase